MIRPDRREFIRMMVRDGLLAGIGFLGVSLIGRRAESHTGSGCPTDQICQGCGHLSGCPESRAEEARMDRMNRSDRSEEADGASVR